MDNNKKYKIIAIIVALLFHIGVILVMVFSFLKSTPIEEVEPKPMMTDITFGGEYVVLGDMPVPNRNSKDVASQTNSKQTPEGDAEENLGEAGEGSQLVSTNEESALKKPKKQSGPTKEELAEQERIKKEKQRKEEESRKIKSSIKNAFGKKSGGEGKSGSPEGNETHGALSGQPGHTLGVGYTLSSWARPSSGFDGEVVIKVRVDATGKVVEAHYLKGSGSAAASKAVRKSCEQASKNSRFSVPKNASGDKMGTIIWRFE